MTLPNPHKRSPSKASDSYTLSEEYLELEVVTLSGERFVRPANEIGTCGFSPKPWQIALIEEPETPTEAFLRENINWEPFEHELLVR